MPSDCAFELNKKPATYFSGETISGTITLATTSDKNVREVCIIFLGEGKVKWDESHTTNSSSDNTTTSTTQYRSHETYVNNSTRVHGDGVLPAGTYTFTFNIPLPWECPTSCEGKFGHIRYEISLKINRYYRFDNVYKKPVTIIRTMDLNLNPVYKLPIVLENCSISCCWPCSKGKIVYALKMPFGAYALGQNVSYALEIANQSMDDINGYKLEFVQKITFNARTPHRKERHITKVLLSKNITDTCLRLSNRVLDGEFYIPAIPPTTERASIIYVEYYLKITVQLPYCMSNIELKVPLVIGTIPIRESLTTNQCLSDNQQTHFPPSAPQISKTDSDAAVNNSPPNYLDIKPPTFEETIRSNSLFLDTDIDDRNRIISFTPLYPVDNSSCPEK